MARIPLFPLPEMTPEQQRVYDAIVQGPRGRIQGPLRAALHRPELADKWQQLGELLRYRTSLPSRLSELAILVTARHWDSQFEWYAHAPIAARAGLDAAVIEAIRDGKRPSLADQTERCVHDFSREMLANHTVADGTYQSTLEALGTVGVVELTALVGYYSMVALTLNVHEISLPEGVAPPLPARR